MWDLGISSNTWDALMKDLEDAFQRDHLRQNRSSRWEYPISPESKCQVFLERETKRWDERIEAMRVISNST